jgi:hypothetical protein
MVIGKQMGVASQLARAALAWNRQQRVGVRPGSVQNRKFLRLPVHVCM